MLGDLASVCLLALSFFAVTHREGFNRLAPHFLRQGRDHTGIQSAAEEDAQGHIAHQVTGYGPFKQVAIALHVIITWALNCICGIGQVPILRDLQFSGLADFQSVAGKKLLDAGKHCLRTREIAERKILRQHAVIELCLYPRILEDRLDLGPKQKGTAVEVIVKRLDSKPVARNEQTPLAPVPDGKGKHSRQPLHTFRAVLLVKMENGFSIAFRPVTVAARFEFSAQLPVVVNLPVVYDPQVLILIGNRLMHGLHIDDAESPNRQSQIAVDVGSVFVGATMNNLRAHSGKSVLLHPSARIPMKDPAYSAHEL